MDILEKINKFYKNYNGEKEIIGYTLLNKPIHCFHVEKTKHPKVICQYGIHAREYITTYLAIKHIKDFEKNGKYGSVYFIPTANADGIKKCLTGNPLYKANSRGVDLNVNFDARWGSGIKNVVVCGEENYIGRYPFSEKESRTLRDFTLKIMPDITLSFHSKGEVIYYGNDKCKRVERAEEKLASVLANKTAYMPLKITDSAGGYRDWCSEKLNIPSLTIEVGNDSLIHPIRAKDLRQIYNKTKDIIPTVTEIT